MFLLRLSTEQAVTFMRRYFYIDSENISSKCWVDHLGELSGTDTVYVFYSINSPSLPLSRAFHFYSCKARILPIKVVTGSPNAMDFMLVSYLSRKTLSASKSKHYILSNDTGYDIVIGWLMDSGISVQRRPNLVHCLKEEK